MSAANIVMSAAGGTVAKLYVDDVFSAYTYTGNGSTQTITNGIDLAGKGGLVWIKRRGMASNHFLCDTANGATKYLRSDQTNGLATYTDTLTGFTSTGFTLGADASTDSVNVNTRTHVSWTFRNADKFYGHTTVTKSSGSNVTASFSNLGTLGMVRVKRTDSTGSWYVWHRSLTAGKLLIGETTAAEATLGHITVSGTTVTLVNGVIADGSYLVEAWAHDTSTDGIIQCGSYVGSGAAGNPINIGFEPQFLLIKRTDTTDNWTMFDTARGFNVSGTSVNLNANLSQVETLSDVRPNATGFEFGAGSFNNVGGTFIYLAIRRPNKPPTTGTQVYNAIARTASTNAVVSTVGFAPDAILETRRATSAEWTLDDRLRGATKSLYTSSTAAETTTNRLVSFEQLGFTEGAYWSGYSTIYQCFRRAPGFMDVVCYTGTGSATTVAHGLGVVPELMIWKARNQTGYGWKATHTGLTNPDTYYLTVNSTNGQADVGHNFIYSRTASSLTFVADLSSVTYDNVCYLFATLAGISKCGSYTGNGSSQTINCGFTTGARLVLIKKTSGTGDWLLADSTRGLVAGGDPRLSLNTTAAEVTGEDWLDPDTSGFIVNQTTADANASGATYIFLAIS